MISIWSTVGLLVLSMFSGVITGCAVAILGGMGVITALRKRLEMVEISQENLDRRLTTEVKTRASLKGVEARTGAKSLQDEARDRLEVDTPPAGSKRPTVLGRFRR